MSAFVPFLLQLLEFLGDAVLDLCISWYHFQRYPLASPSDLHDLHSAIVSSSTLCVVAHQWEMHNRLLHSSHVLPAQFAAFSALCEVHDVGDPSTDVWCIDGPKAIGNVVESMIGAFFLLSGCDIRRSMQYIFSLFSAQQRRVCQQFEDNIPLLRNPVRHLNTVLARNGPVTAKTRVVSNDVRELLLFIDVRSRPAPSQGTSSSSDSGKKQEKRPKALPLVLLRCCMALAQNKEVLVRRGCRLVAQALEAHPPLIEALAAMSVME